MSGKARVGRGFERQGSPGARLDFAVRVLRMEWGLGKFTVEILPTAWDEVGRVPSAVFDRIRIELSNRAELESLQLQLGIRGRTGPSANHFFYVDEFLVTFRLDERRRVLELVSVARRR